MYIYIHIYIYIHTAPVCQQFLQTCESLGAAAVADLPFSLFGSWNSSSHHNRDNRTYKAWAERLSFEPLDRTKKTQVYSVRSARLSGS